MKTVLEVRSQLQDLCARQGIRPSAQCPETETVRRCLLGGLFTNVAEHMRDGKYRTVRLSEAPAQNKIEKEEAYTCTSKLLRNSTQNYYEIQH